MSEALEWCVERGIRTPGKRWVVILIALATLLFGILVVRLPLAGVAGCVAILFATQEIWLPVHFRLDSNVARSKCGWSVQEIRWDSVKRIQKLGNFILVTPITNPGKLDDFRGVRLEPRPPW